MSDNVIPFAHGKLPLAQDVFNDAAAKDLEHVMVVGVTRDGDNYFKCNGNTTLGKIAWMLVSAQNAVMRMLTP